jgi:uncharacterized protein with FMN-binding domain
MKRAFLIAGGTVGGLGAVLAITPPQITSNESALGTGVDMAPATTSPTTATSSASPATTTTSKVTTSAKPVATKPSSIQSATAKPAATQSSTAEPAPAATKATNGKATNGPFVGDPSTMRYGTVQVQITISGGKITDAQAIQAPSGRDQRYTDRAVPVMRQKTLAAQSSNITGVTGASFTAYAWYVSLQSALKKAGWM